MGYSMRVAVFYLAPSLVPHFRNLKSIVFLFDIKCCMHSSASNLGEYSMKIYLLATSSLMISGSLALAGGYELQTLDTSAMYEDGSFVSISYGSINSNLKGKDTGGTKVKTLKDQTLTNLAFKTQVGEFGLGLTTYRSGAIQMSGSSNSTFTGNSIEGNYIT